MSVTHREKNRSRSSVAHNRNKSFVSSSLVSRREGELTSADSLLTGHTVPYTHPAPCVMSAAQGPQVTGDSDPLWKAPGGSMLVRGAARPSAMSPIQMTGAGALGLGAPPMPSVPAVHKHKDPMSCHKHTEYRRAQCTSPTAAPSVARAAPPGSPHQSCSPCAPQTALHM